MGPEQIKTISALVALINSVGVMPMFSAIALITLLPWLALIFISLNQHRRFETVVTMYENNFSQVEEIRNLAEGYRDHLIWSTQTVTEAKEIAENNMHCPIVRKNSKPKDLG